jgi:hypothetical protein
MTVSRIHNTDWCLEKLNASIWIFDAMPFPHPASTIAMQYPQRRPQELLDSVF